MNNIQKIGGLSAILFGIIIFASFVLITLPIVSMPPEAMETTNVEARLVFASSLPENQRLMLTVGFGLEVLVALFIFPVLLALYAKLKSVSDSHAIIAAGLGTISIPFFVIEHLPRFSFLGLSARYAVAGATERTSLVATYAHTESLGLVAESVFWLFFGVALALYAMAMLRAAFPRWLAIFGLLIAFVAMVGAIGSVAIIELSFLEFAALILLSVWFIGIGIKLYREVPEVALLQRAAEAS
jgi:hypothetical protein